MSGDRPGAAENRPDHNRTNREETEVSDSTNEGQTVGQAKDILTAALRQIDAAVRGSFPGNAKVQKAALQSKLTSKVYIDPDDLQNLAATLPSSD